jgi:uncharacterized RDD family membrane protein YckC
MSWYYASNQQQMGPLSEEALNQKISTGEILPSTLVWCEGMSDWKTLSKVRGGSAFVTSPGMVRCLCGNTFPQAETVKIGQCWVCSSCKDTAIQQLKEGVMLGGGAASLNFAGFWIRFAAKFIDIILLFVVSMIIQFACSFLMLATGRMGNPTPGTIELFMGLLMFVLQMLIKAAYNIYFIGKFGATPGKMICHLKVVRPDGSSLGYGRAAGRYFSEWVSYLTCWCGMGIGYIMAAFDEEKQSLHDRMADTRVIQQ